MYQTNHHNINEKLLQLVQGTGYSLIQKNGQRVYSRPNDIVQQVKGCEVFVGKLPKDVFEDELVPLFSRFGAIRQLRLMLDFTGKSRGFAFVCYYNSDTANTVVTALHNFEIRPGHCIGVYKSVDNCRLFVGGIPPDITKEQVYQGLSEFVEGIMKVIMYPSHENKNHNRGFAFIEFVEHRAAAMARRKLSPGSLVLWSTNILVDWADPLPEPDPKIMSTVTKLYVRNLPVEMTNQDLWHELQKVLLIETVTKTHKIKDYAFIHFVDRKSAEEGLRRLQYLHVKGQDIEVTWARPRIYSKEYRMNNPPDNFCLSLPPKMRKLVMNRQNNVNGESPTSSTTHSGISTPTTGASGWHLSPTLQQSPAMNNDALNEYLEYRRWRNFLKDLTD